MRVRGQFLLKHASSQRVGRVDFVNGAGALQNDLPSVVRLIAEVDGASRDLAAVSEDGFVHVMAEHPGPAEGWQQRGVNIQHTTCEVVRDVQQTQITSEHDKLRAALAHERKNRFGDSLR